MTRVRRSVITGREVLAQPVFAIEQRRTASGRYTGRVGNNSEAGLERIVHLEEQLSRAPINSGRHRLLAKAIRIEAALYRKSLDIAQASEQFDPKAERPVTSHVSQRDRRLKS